MTEFKHTPGSIIRTYLTLVSLNTLAASFIWGINTLFLLDAGLNNTQTFAANAFFTFGQVVFEVPTGVTADFRGRRFSFLLGSFTLLVSTLLYLLMWRSQGPFWGWALSSVMLGLGFTFFSGATEAWLVDALECTGYKNELDDVFAKGQVASGVAMLAGSVAGGFIAQYFGLAAPYLLRSAALVIAFLAAFFLMIDLGFEPERGQSPWQRIKGILSSSAEFGFRRPAVRWIMLTAPFTAAVTFYCFYAMQPYILDLYGDKTAYAIAGATAAIFAGSQILGGVLAARLRKMFQRRTTMMLWGQILLSLILFLFLWVGTFWFAITAAVFCGLLTAAVAPVRQTYVNGMIPSKQRATVLSLDSLMGAAGGMIFQTPLGKAADVWGYPVSFAVSGLINACSLPFFALARRQDERSDFVVKSQ